MVAGCLQAPVYVRRRPAIPIFDRYVRPADAEVIRECRGLPYDEHLPKLAEILLDAPERVVKFSVSPAVGVDGVDGWLHFVTSPELDCEQGCIIIA